MCEIACFKAKVGGPGSCLPMHHTLYCGLGWGRVAYLSRSFLTGEDCFRLELYSQPSAQTAFPVLHHDAAPHVPVSPCVVRHDVLCGTAVRVLLDCFRRTRVSSRRERGRRKAPLMSHASTSHVRGLSLPLPFFPLPLPSDAEYVHRPGCLGGKQ